VPTIILRLIAWWLGLLGLYLLLAGKLSGAEVLAGSVVAVLAVVALSSVRAQSKTRFDWKLAWARPLAGVPWRMISDSVLVLRANCARPFRNRGSGRFSERKFNPGNDHAIARTRRALVAAAISLPPNSYVLAIDRAAGRILVHELVPQRDAQRDPDWPL
jgi:multisubunit Na+/H+ antiporter MnhE subunit